MKRSILLISREDSINHVIADNIILRPYFSESNENDYAGHL